MSSADSQISFNPNVNALHASATGWGVLALILGALSIATAVAVPRDLARGEDVVETYTAIIMCLAIAIPMVVFGVRRFLQQRSAAQNARDVALELGPKGVTYRNGATEIDARWSDLENPEDAASFLRRRDAYASLVLVTKGSLPLNKRTQRRLRKAHRLGILAPTSVGHAVHIPLRFLQTKTKHQIGQDVLRYWTEYH